MGEPIKNRYEFVVLFDVENGNQMEIRMREMCQELTGKWAWISYRCLFKTQDS